MTHTYDYPRPMVACTAIIQRSDGAILMGRRKGPTEEGRWSLPGGFLEADKETATECVRREVREECGFETAFWKLFSQRSHPCTDPRGHVVNLIYAHHFNERLLGQPGYGMAEVKLTAGDDLLELRWWVPGVFPGPGGMAFDHADILKEWLSR